MLWIYSSNDTYFEPELSKQVHEAFTGVGGIAEFHLLPPFGGDGEALHAISMWTPIVDQFLDKHQSELGCDPTLKTCGPRNVLRDELRPDRCPQRDDWEATCARGFI